MKKQFYLTLMGVFLCLFTSLAQGDEYYGQSEQYYQQSELLTNPTVQPPDVAAFQKVNFVPVSNYTGRANISIPIFTVSSGNISVPISLSYNSGGIKVNDIPSSVGSNWSLNAGGVISKIVRGMEDFQSNHNHGFVFDFDHYCGDVGFLYQKYHTPDNGWWGDNDTNPDIFIVSAPGLSTKYTHNSNSPSTTTSNGSTGDVFELTGGQNKIVEIVSDIPTGYYKTWDPNISTTDWNNYIDGPYISGSTLKGISKITVTSISGLEYTFDKIDISQNSRFERPRNANTSNWKPGSVKVNYKTESHHLSKIKDLKTGKEVTFEFEEYKRASYDPVDGSYFYSHSNPSSSSDQFHMDPYLEVKSTKYPKLQRLTKVIHELGTVEFIYGQTRQDITDDKALTQIIIKDINGDVVKKFNLVYTYVSNPSYTTSNLNKRLQLDEVYFSSPLNNNLNKYKFTYNATKLPPRGSWGKDFLGYHNGSHTTSISDPKPNIYFYPDSGLHSFLPVNKGTGYYLLNGQFSLASDIAYTKAGILEKIEYPTGGFSEFDYELNEFKLGSTTISGGGLRIKSQKIVDENANEQIMDYEYKKTDNSSSGMMVAMPNFVDFRVKGASSGPTSPTSQIAYKIYRVAQTQAEFTNNSFVGYSRVIVKNRVSNGYTEYTYNSPESHPDEMHLSSPTAGTIEAVAKNNGKRSSTLSKEVYRGQLISSAVYNSSDIKQRETVNSYTYKKFSDLTLTHNIQLCGTSTCFAQDYIGPVLTETIKIPSERYLLTQSITTNYLDGGNTSVTKLLTYDLNYPLITTSTTNDGLKIVKNDFFYPHSSGVSSNAYMSNLRDQNRYSEMIKQEAFNDGVKIYTEVIKYNDFGNSIYLPTEIETAKGSETLEIGATITKRDIDGNILEYKTKDNVYTSFVYGFDNSILLAKIENAEYFDVIAEIPITIPQLQDLDSFNDESTLQGYFDTIRTNLPDAKVVSYTYIPSVGVSTITDNRGKRMTYVYDEFNRLSLIKDQDLNIIKRYQYNYKNQ
jgi:hypothetical protein